VGGRVIIRLRPEGTGEFRLEVEDNGVGIKAEDLGRLFIEFQQLDTGTTKKYQGTGLGLALTRRLVEAQGGRVGVKSRVGAGSVFFAVLPRTTNRTAFVPTRPPAETRNPAHPSDGAAILVVDDNPSALKLIEIALRQRGFRPRCTDNPEIALRIAALHPPDVLILDLLMPALPGSVFLERFRALPGAQDTPVIVWTVKDLSPVERNHLLSLCQEIVQKREGGASALLEAVYKYASPGPADTEQPS
jgi:CheY-like chemotaxis protein